MTEALQKKELTQGERFTSMVMAEFKAGTNGELAISDFQKRLMQNCFIAIDNALGIAEDRRKKKTGKYQDPLPVVWANVNMKSLAISIVNTAKVGLDPAQKNHISFVPFKVNGKYEIVHIRGYVGLEVVAKKYALEVPTSVVCELVFSTDGFKAIKRGPTNAYESYEHEIINPFARGEIVGGFAYFIYSDPVKNRLMIMSLEDILKRRPKHASTEFWGGEKPIYKDNKIVGTEKVDGWLKEMCLKTIKRAAYDSIPIDPEKVDAAYMGIKQREREFAEVEIAQEIDENANREILDIESHLVVDQEQEPELQPEPQLEQPSNVAKDEPQHKQQSLGDDINEAVLKSSPIMGNKAMENGGPGY